MMTPYLNVTRPWRSLMTLPEETVIQMVTKVTSLKYDLDEMTKVCITMMVILHLQISFLLYTYFEDDI